MCGLSLQLHQTAEACLPPLLRCKTGSNRQFDPTPRDYNNCVKETRWKPQKRRGASNPRRAEWGGVRGAGGGSSGWG